MKWFNTFYKFIIRQIITIWLNFLKWVLNPFWSNWGWFCLSVNVRYKVYPISISNFFSSFNLVFTPKNTKFFSSCTLYFNKSIRNFIITVLVIKWLYIISFVCPFIRYLCNIIWFLWFRWKWWIRVYWICLSIL